MTRAACLAFAVLILTVAPSAHARPKARRAGLVKRVVHQRIRQPLRRVVARVRAARADKAAFKRLLRANPALRKAYKTALRNRDATALRTLGGLAVDGAQLAAGSWLASTAMELAQVPGMKLLGAAALVVGTAQAAVGVLGGASSLKHVRAERAAARRDTLAVANKQGVALTARQRRQASKGLAFYGVKSLTR